MSLSLASILAILVSFQLAFIATFLLTNQKGNRLSNSLLGLLFAFISLNLADLALQLITSPQAPIWLGQLNDAFLFLFGPLLFLYTQSNIYSNFQLKLKHLLHGIPSFFMLAIFTAILFTEEGFVVPYKTQSGPSPSVYIYSLILYLQLSCYYFFSRSVLQDYRKNIRENYSNLQERT